MITLIGYISKSYGGYSMFINNKNIAVVGGDLRQVHLAQGFIELGFDVFLLGFDSLEETPKKVIKSDDIHDITQCGIVIFPIPFSNNEETINSPYSSKNIHIDDVLDVISSTTLCFGGRISNKINDKFTKIGVETVDYFKREELEILNAIPTAEGAIEIAMSETGYTIHSSNCLITGFGRISKILAKMLKGLGANVTVLARKYSDLAWIDALGYKAVHFSKLEKEIVNCNILFNTVPQVVLNEEILRNMNRDTLIIDLASKPGGVDFEAAKKFNLKVIWALSLPGKVAPITSGKIIQNTIINILNEKGVKL